MWKDVESTTADHLVSAIEVYRKSPAVVRECVVAELMGCDTPESYDRLERIALKQGTDSFDQAKLDGVNRNVEAILFSLRRAGFRLAESTGSAQS